MDKIKLKQYLLKEEAHEFKGWDFSYLNGRWEDEPLPWDYREIVLQYLQKDMRLLDMGTGDGAFLLSLNHPYTLTDVTEGYEPNIKLCQEKLSPIGITVYPVKDDFLTNVSNQTYDLVINRHESYNEAEIRRVLKPQGIFITQQVGAYNNKDLATFFDPNHCDQAPEMTLNKSVKRLIQAGFTITYQNEAFPKLKFFDLGAIAFFAKIIEWEFVNFSVEKTFDKFLILENELKSKGYIESTEHRLIIVAQKH